MHPRHIALLFFLSAIWGGSFVFIIKAVPEFGPYWMSWTRLLIAGIALWLWLRLVQRKTMRWRENWRRYFLVGAFACALPFPMFGYAAKDLTAGYAAVINSLVPLWGALFTSAWLYERFTWHKAVGLLLGVSGVCLMVGVGPLPTTQSALIAVGLCVVATVFYAISQVATKRWAPHVDSVELSTGMQLSSVILLLPTLPWTMPSVMPGLTAWGSILTLALVSSAFATALFMRLIVQIGPTKTMTVPMLIPMFGIAWGVLFLNERLTLPMMAGAGLVLAATFIVLRAPHMLREDAPAHLRGKLPDEKIAPVD